MTFLGWNYWPTLLRNMHLDIPFSDMDCNWLRRYETWLRKQGKSENTIGIRFRNIRVIFNLAMNMELVKPQNYPFKKFKVSKLHQETAKRALNKNDILAVINYPVKEKDFYTRLAVCNRKSGIHQNRQRGYIKNGNNRTSETVTTVHQKR